MAQKSSRDVTIPGALFTNVTDANETDYPLFFRNREGVHPFCSMNREMK